MSISLAPIRIGPVALSGERLLVAVAVLAALVCVELVARRRGRDADWAWTAVIVGLLAARLAWVTAHLPAYLARPQEILFVWQGGFTAWAGALAAVAWAVGRSWRAPGPRIRDLLPGLAAAGAAGVVTLALLPAEPAPPSLDTVRAPLTSMSGEVAAPADWVGRPLVVNLWATWCGPCRRELPMLIEELEAREGIDLALASQGEAQGTVARYLEAEGLAAQAVWLDPEQALSRAYGVVGLPTTLFVDRSGEVRRVAFGELNRARLAASLGALGP
ncbi:MAG: TlpA disulfide reductase family protein [Trueperaceae bacterium]|nr:TlpA disulfide reductase family protein [Trueperaceae bacterium]